MPHLPPHPEFLVKQTRLILSSYRHWKKESLLPENLSDEKLVEKMFLAPFIVASAGIESDPILNYGNQKALDLWEMDWETFTRTPGRHTAEAPQREDREKFLATVKKQGYIDDYKGIRVSSAGKRFEIQRATVWNLLDEKGNYAGQAVTFKDVKFL